jgi:hypothetical protein
MSAWKVASFYTDLSWSHPALPLDSWRSWWAWSAASAPTCWGPERGHFASAVKGVLCCDGRRCSVFRFSSAEQKLELEREEDEL